MKFGELLGKLPMLTIGFKFRPGGNKHGNFTRDHRFAGREQPPDYSSRCDPDVCIRESWHEHAERSKEKGSP